MYPEEEQPEKFVIVPRKSLSKEAFDGLISEFILREGTDYGHDEISLDDKRERVIQQIEDREVKILFSSKTENCTLIKSSEIPFEQMMS